MDQILITRDTQGFRDDTFNQSTGQYVAPAQDIQTIYAGPAAVWCKGGTTTQNREKFAGQDYTVVPYGALLPLGSPTIMAYDKLTVTFATYSQELLSKIFFVTQGSVNTFSVLDEIFMEDRIQQLFPG